MATSGKARVKNAADREQVTRARETEQFDRDEQLNDVRTVLSTVAGRRFWWRLLGDCGVHASVMTADALTMAYRAGQQDVGHQLEAEVMAADPQLYLQMQREHFNRERTLTEPNDTLTDPPDDSNA